MPELDFAVKGVGPVPLSMTPMLAFELEITNRDPGEVHSIALDCQVRIEAHRRRYNAAEKERLFELFGEPSRWTQTLGSLLWVNVSTNVAPFTGATMVDLMVPCTYDFNVLGAKYFDALQEADVPLTMLFSGTVFYAAEEGGLQMTRISWSKEAAFKLPLQAWKSVMETYYPNTAFVALRKDVFDRLRSFKSSQWLPTWEATLESLLDRADAESHPETTPTESASPA